MGEPLRTDIIRYISPTDGRDMIIPCWLLDLDWPPPETLELEGKNFTRLRYSSLSDEQAKECTFITRGAEYVEVPHG